MFREFLKAKIHLPTISESNLHYRGSLMINEEILEKSGILPNEKTDVFNISNG